MKHTLQVFWKRRRFQQRKRWEEESRKGTKQAERARDRTKEKAEIREGAKWEIFFSKAKKNLGTEVELKGLLINLGF